MRKNRTLPKFEDKVWIHNCKGGVRDKTGNGQEREETLMIR